MEAAAGRGGSLPMSSSQPPRKEWRAVSEHSYRNNETEEVEHVNMGHSDERTIYEEGAGPHDVEFCSITIDGGGLSDDMLQQRLQEITRQREELHRIEVELRARAIARSEIMELQSRYESRIKEHVDAVSKLKEELQGREQHIIEFEMKLEVKDRELRAVKIDNEAAWAKDDLLREQNKELATFRRERDNSEAERSQHLKKIHDLQEHIQEKESQFLALEEQHRVAQETNFFKDEQLREAQAWIARAQEVDALHSTTNQSLQAELRDRTEQFNQYWIGFQRQFADMERHHLQAIHQLQLELAEAREHTGFYKDGSQVTRENSRNSSSYVQNKGNPIDVNGGDASNGNMVFLSNGNLDSAQSFGSASDASTKAEQVSGVQAVPSSILGMSAFLPPSQMTPLHPFVIHPQGVPQPISSTHLLNPQSHLGHFQPVSTTLVQQWQNEQEASDISQIPNPNKYQPSQTEQNILESNAPYGYQHSAERHAIPLDHLNTSLNPHQRSGPVINGSSDELQVLESEGNQYQVSQESQEFENAKLQLHASLGYDPQTQKIEVKVQEEKAVASINQSQEQGLTSVQQWSDSSVASSAAETHSVSSNNVAESNDGAQVSNLFLAGKAIERTLLDERSLLACIVRAIPAGSDGRIRISTTLPNRLAKMLAPLHWHDYKKFYGKLDDFVAHHPELFVIEGDFIHLREGAQEIISATTAYAKVAAAAAASSAPYSSLLPSIAVTPVAQNNRQKKALSVDSKPAKTISTDGGAVTNPVDSGDRRSQNSKVHGQQPNGISFNAEVSSKSKDLNELNGLASGATPGHSSVYATVGNGANLGRASIVPSQNKGSSNGRHGFGGKQQGRSSGAGLISRRQN